MYCLDGRLHADRGRLEWFLADLRDYFRPEAKILDLLANHPTSEYTFGELAAHTQLSESSLDRGLRKLTRRGWALARIEAGRYPNVVRYQLSLVGTKQAVLKPQKAKVPE